MLHTIIPASADTSEGSEAPKKREEGYRYNNNDNHNATLLLVLGQYVATHAYVAVISLRVAEVSQTLPHRCRSMF